MDVTIAHTAANNNIKISLSRISDQVFQVRIKDSGIGMDRETLRNFTNDGFSLGKEIELDIDEDGKNELLIGTGTVRINPEGDDEILGRLICFESTGSIRWEKELASPNPYRHRIHYRNSSLAHIDVKDFDEDGNQEILVVACRWYHPCQILLLDMDKNVIL